MKTLTEDEQKAMLYTKKNPIMAFILTILSKIIANVVVLTIIAIFLTIVLVSWLWIYSVWSAL